MATRQNLNEQQRMVLAQAEEILNDGVGMITEGAIKQAVSTAVQQMSPPNAPTVRVMLWEILSVEHQLALEEQPSLYDDRSLATAA